MYLQAHFINSKYSGNANAKYDNEVKFKNEGQKKNYDVKNTYKNAAKRSTSTHIHLWARCFTNDMSI